MIIAVVIAVVLFGAIWFNNYYHNDIQSKPKVYCYQTYFGPVNPVLMITDLAYADSLIAYYKKMEKGENPTFNFPLKEASFGDPVYLVGYAEDSMLIEIISYRNGKINGSSFDQGYVYYKTVHSTPPEE